LKNRRVPLAEPALRGMRRLLPIALLIGEPSARAEPYAPSAAAPAQPNATNATAAESVSAPAGPAQSGLPSPPPSRPASEQEVLQPRRYELAGFPIVGGTSDIGVQFGAAVTFTRFYDLDFPYAWNIDLLLSGSFKDEDGRVRLEQQSHVLRLDAPDLFSGKVRLDTRASFQRTINAGFFGLGNTSTPLTCPAPYYCNQYVQEEGRVRLIGRAQTGVAGLAFAFGANLRYESPTVYPNSVLSSDIAIGSPGQVPSAIGAQPALLAGLSAGLMVDTRDSEFITQRGIFYQLGVGPTVGSAERVGYGEASAVIAHYSPLGGPFTFASRFVSSFQFGRVPFYDLDQGGVFEPQYLFGGETGVRGVPQGRYGGRIKVLSNTEVRSTPIPRFELFGQHLRIGTTTFFDAGRVWLDYKTISPADGNTIRLKYGVGAGVFLQWGEAAIFRIEAAYSPDAVAESPNLPIEIYVSDGLMF
jgi:hypothetical protein